MSDSHFDVVVIGGGPAGYAAALQAGSAGLSVALVERDKVGGTCLHRGCIPAKELLETAAVRRTVGEAAQFGVMASDGGFDMGIAQGRKERIVGQLHKGLDGLLKRRGVTVVSGTGRLGADRDVHVTSDGAGSDGDGAASTITGDHVLLAAGSVPRTLPGLEVDGRLVMTSDELLELAEVPARVAVVGGGAIGCEFASLLADLGAEVTVLEFAAQLIPGVDADIAKALARSFKKRGITVRTGCSVSGHTPAKSRKAGAGTTVHFAPVAGGGAAGGDGAGEGAAEEHLEVDAVVVSVGRRPFSDLLGLGEGAGDGDAASGAGGGDAASGAGQVAVDERGFVVVDELCRTSRPGVYAAGDLIDTPQLAHVGFAEAIVVVRDILGENPVPVDYANVPWAIYCHPEIAFAGLTEAAAAEAGYDVVSATHRFAGNSRAMIVGGTEGMVKVVAERRAGASGEASAGRILGVHMMGPWVTEQLGQGYLAVNWEATVEEVAAFISPHPTLSELFGEAVLELTGRGLHG